jgi:hypothetical protein
MKFKKEFLMEFEGKTIIDEMVDHSRWSVSHRRIFEFEGKFYETYYSVGATEQQDESPYEYDEDEIDCPEVKPVQKLVTVYEKVEGENDGKAKEL